MNIFGVKMKINDNVQIAIVGALAVIIVAIIPYLIPKDISLELVNFSLNTGDSLYDKSTEQNLESEIIAWIPSNEWWDVANKNNSSQEELSKLRPTFDVVIKNAGSVSLVLKGIDVKIESSIIWQGSGESKPQTRIIQVLNRYFIALPAAHDDSNQKDDRVIKLVANPPIQIEPNDPARFQLTFSSKFEVVSDYVLSVVFIFDHDKRVIVPTFQVSL